MRAVMLGLVAWAWSIGGVRADVSLPALFSDHMVLQQGDQTPVWGSAEPGEEVVVTLEQQRIGTQADAEGNWRVVLKGLQPGGPFVLTVKGKNELQFKDVLIGDVWICSGQSNMEWPVNASADPAQVKAQATHPRLRLFTVAKRVAGTPQNRVAGGPWRECNGNTVGSFSAVGYHFGAALQQARQIPIGLIHTSWGGTPAEAWTSRECLAQVPELAYYLPRRERELAEWSAKQAELRARYQESLEKHKAAAALAKEQGKPAPPAPRPPQDPATSPQQPTHLYNAMIHPLLPYGIKGAIWYQGESNAGRAWEYRTLLPTMIQCWRQAWGRGDFPFYIVQLAPFMAKSSQPGPSAWAELREAQLLAGESLPHCGTVVITDLGDEKDIHPRQKAPVGERLALLARQRTYGEKIVGSGPIYDSVSFEGGKAIVQFRSVGGGLVAKGGPLSGFTICGADQRFVPAEAAIQENRVVVWSKAVPEPVAVRFGWANYPEVNLYNQEGLPASPFRTDRFPVSTQPRQ